jgi:large subunit ribosomal protein L4
VAGWATGGSVLVVLAEEQARVALSFRNLARVSVLPATGVGVADLVGAAQVLATEEALAHLTARATGAAQAEEA